MSQLTLELPAELETRLQRTAKRLRTTPAKLALRSLESALPPATEAPSSSLYERSRDLCGSATGGPGDLARNKQHLRGYGAWKR